MQLEKKHRALLAILMEGDDHRGMSLTEIGEQLGSQRGPKLAIPLHKLNEEGYTEDRWSAGPWPDGTGPTEVKPKHPRRFYRITDKGAGSPALTQTGWIYSTRYIFKRVS